MQLERCQRPLLPWLVSLERSQVNALPAACRLRIGHVAWYSGISLHTNSTSSSRFFLALLSAYIHTYLKIRQPAGSVLHLHSKVFLNYSLFVFISCQNTPQWRNSTFWQRFVVLHATKQITHGRLAVPYHNDSVRCSYLGRGLPPYSRLLLIRLLLKQTLEEERLATGHELSLSHLLHVIIYIQRCENNDGDTFWEMRRLAISSLCEHLLTQT